ARVAGPDTARDRRRGAQTRRARRTRCPHGRGARARRADRGRGRCCRIESAAVAGLTQGVGYTVRSSVGDQQSAAAGKQTSRPAAGRSPAPAGTTKPAHGLRELKKARTAAAIQRHAMNLFEANGYDATPVEAVAAAAEVAPSTVYRYFPTKEDLVISDEFDNVLFTKLADQPADVGVVDAVRAAFHGVTAEMSEADIALGRRRTRLM